MTDDVQPKYVSNGEGTTLQGLHAFLDTLKRLGVRRYEGILDTDTVSVEFFPATPISAPADATPLTPRDFKAADAPVCACGHSMLSHNESSECILGCEPTRCVGEPRPA